MVLTAQGPVVRRMNQLDKKEGKSEKGKHLTTRKNDKVGLGRGT